MVIRLDVEDLFASVRTGRALGLFRTAGFPEAVAHMLTGLTTNVVPVEERATVTRPTIAPLITAHHRLGRHLAAPHLPQGADLARPGQPRVLRRSRDPPALGRLAPPDRTDRRRGGLPRQRAQVTADAERWPAAPHRDGVNERPNVARSEYDQLKAILHNAPTRGPGDENRAGHPDFRAHLLGRIAWVGSLNPERGAKLPSAVRAIDWPDGPRDPSAERSGPDGGTRWPDTNVDLAPRCWSRSTFDATTTLNVDAVAGGGMRSTSPRPDRSSRGRTSDSCNAPRR